MNKAIVTGANGFIGTALCRELTAQGVRVIAVVRDKNANIDTIKNLPDIRIIYCDISQFRNLGSFIDDRDVDILYHLAWVGSAGPLRGNADAQLNNIKYACDTVRACKDTNCRRFVFASSIMEYEIEAVMSSDKKPGINTLYSTAKLTADYMVRTLAGNLGVEYIRGVISNIYGPGEMSPRLVNTSLRKMLNGEHCSFSAGDQMYDFIYIDDAAKSFVAIGERGVPNRTYYIGSQQPRPLKEYLIEMRDQVDSSIEIGLGELPFNGISLGYDEFDINAIKKDTGFVPEVSFADGIKKTIEWLKAQITGFSFTPLALKDAFLIQNFYVGDNRGGFTKCFEKSIYQAGGIEFQLNETFSSVSAKNVIRGLHFQLHNPQAKLVSVVKGRVWDVIVDLRPNSPTYKHWDCAELSDENHRSLFVPRGFAHGFASLEDGTVMLYQCDGQYDKATDTGIRFDDPDIGINWPIDEAGAIHSGRDLKLQSFQEYLKNPMEL